MRRNDRTRRRSQGNSVLDPSRAIPTNPPPTYHEATSNEAPPPYDGVRLPPYAEAMLLDRDRPDTLQCLRQITVRTHMVQRETHTIISQIRELQGDFLPNSRIARRLDAAIIDLRALSDMAYLRETNARIIRFRLEEQVMLLRREQHRAPGDSWRSRVLHTRIRHLRNQIADIHREAMAAPDGVEQMQIWRNQLRRYSGTP